MPTQATPDPPNTAPLAMAVPAEFRYHTATSPVLVFCSSRSARVSVLKSAAPNTFHAVPEPPSDAPAEIAVPAAFRYQIATLPVVLSHSTMSDRASELKSAAPAIFHCTPPPPSAMPAEIAVPAALSVQMATSPLPESCS